MKHFVLILFLFGFATLCIAQPTTSGKRIDTDVKILTRRFESIERIIRAPKNKNSAIRYKRAIESAEKALLRFKKKHPDYDTSKFENALNTYRDPQKIASESNNSPTKSTRTSFSRVEDFAELIDEILALQSPAREFLRSKSDATEMAQKKLSDFRSNMKAKITPEIKAIAAEKNNRKVKRISEKAIRRAIQLESELSKTDIARIKNDPKPNIMLMRYFEVIFAKEKLETLQQIFDNDELSKANNVANTLIAKLGTIDQIEKRGKANYAARVAKVRLFPERQKSQALKRRFISAFKGSPFTQKDFAKSEILKVHLVNSGWSVRRNKLTGIILSRDQQAQFALKKADGKCYSYLVLFEQKSQGGGKYGGVYMRSGSSQEMLCSNVPK